MLKNPGRRFTVSTAFIQKTLGLNSEEVWRKRRYFLKRMYDLPVLTARDLEEVWFLRKWTEKTEFKAKATGSNFPGRLT